MSRRPLFFSSQNKFREWLVEHHQTADELIVGFWKVGSGRPSMTWSESVDQALCFGWIDGVRRRIDDQSYSIRFTPRRANSIWSRINIDKVARLQAAGLMTRAGLAAFERRTHARSGVYSYERPPEELSETSRRQFASNEAAWRFFSAQPPSYRRTISRWVNSAKQESTRERRLRRLIKASTAGKRLT